jgi:hypothetical protein
MTQQRQNPIADQVCVSEIAGDEQQVAGNEDLALGKPVTSFLCGDEPTDEAGAGLPASCLRRARKIIIEALLRGRQISRLLRRPGWVEEL